MQKTAVHGDKMAVLLVEDGHLDVADFRAFTYENPVALWSGTNPDFFAGTVIESRLT